MARVSYTFSLNSSSSSKSGNHLEALFDFVNSHLTLMESAFLEYQYFEPKLENKIKLPKPIQKPVDQYLARFLPRMQNVTTHLVGQLCPICLQCYLPDQKCRRLKCLHTYHAKCIDRWLGDNLDELSCPVCRQSQY